MSNITPATISALVALMQKAPSIVTLGQEQEAFTALNDLLSKAIEGTTDSYAENGAIALTSRTAKITKDGSAVLTLAAPDHDGQRMTIVSATSNTHIVYAMGLINYDTGAIKDVMTFTDNIGASIELIGLDGKWSVLSLVDVTITID